jgi:hypothetical protein
MTEQEILEMVEILTVAFETKVSKERLVAINKMLAEIGDFYFSSPASSKESYHYAFPGGLAKHSMNVYKNLKTLNETFNCGFSDETMFICSMFHDIGKCVTTNLNEPHYVPAEKWRQEKLGQNYEYSKNGVYLPNHQRSMFILQTYGVKLTADEYQAILLNDGQYLDENKGYKMKECPLALYLHVADRLACEMEGNEK